MTYFNIIQPHHIKRSSAYHAYPNQPVSKERELLRHYFHELVLYQRPQSARCHEFLVSAQALRRCGVDILQMRILYPRKYQYFVRGAAVAQEMCQSRMHVKTDIGETELLSCVQVIHQAERKPFRKESMSMA